MFQWPGPWDYVAHRLANALVGNGQQAATLEVTWLGPELRIEQETRFAVTGADLHVTLDGADVPLGVPLRCCTGSVLCFGERRAGARAYVAFDGGVAVPRVLGSRATHLPSGFGGIGGRQLTAGDRVPLGDPRSDVASHLVDPEVAHSGAGAAGATGETAAQQVRSAGGARLRVLPGPQLAESGPTALEALQRTRYTVSPQSNRMGYRLAGDVHMPGVSRGDMVSESTFVGGVQLPPSGEPILLMADRQTSGGYPQIAVVITADLPLAGQLGPGDWIEFEACSRPEAIAALRDMDEALRVVWLTGGLRPAAGVPMAPMTSLGVGGAARWFSRATTIDDVVAACRWSGDAGVPLCVLGGGTNMIVADTGVDALVLQVAIRGVDFYGRGASTSLRLGAGEPWDDAVSAAVSRGLAGLECLSGIPGSAGGTPVQNVGAYGQEVAQTIAEVTALDRESWEVVALGGSECGFGYRTSRFKGADEGRFIVCEVRFDLSAEPPTVAYPAVIGHLTRHGVAEPALMDVP